MPGDRLAAAQPWSTGSVGMYGTSYSGFNALQVATERPPALKAVVTIYASDDRYTDDVHYTGGALKLLDLVDYPLYMVALNALPPVPAIAGPEWRERVEGLEPWLLRGRRHRPAGGAAGRGQRGLDQLRRGTRRSGSRSTSGLTTPGRCGTTGRWDASWRSSGTRGCWSGWGRRPRWRSCGQAVRRVPGRHLDPGGARVPQPGPAPLPQRPEPLEPGVVEPVELELDATSWMFPAGHRLRLSLAGTDWPNLVPPRPQ